MMMALRAWQGQPRPMQLISVVPQDMTNAIGEVVERNMAFQLHDENLKHVMGQVELGMPVAIVSVVGAFRSGKSFLLSCFLQILKTDDGDDTFDEGFLGGTSGRRDGFSWKSGHEPHTKGMTVWSKPFIRELSACQVYNVKSQVQADSLDSLAVYLEYAKAAKDKETGGEHQDEAPFQRLEVLIRDWQNWENRNEPKEGSCEKLRQEFLDYLDGILHGATTSTVKVKGYFRDRVGCFGLPYPGEDVTSLSFDGGISKIDEGFRRLVAYYVKNVVLDKLKATNVPGFSNNAPDEFVFSVMQIVKCFSDGLTNGVLPVAGAWLDMIHETYNRNHIEEILDTFKAEMDKHSQSSVNRAKLPTLLKEHKNDAMGRFRPRGDEATKADAKEALLVQLEKEADRMTPVRGNLLNPWAWWPLRAW